MAHLATFSTQLSNKPTNSKLLTMTQLEKLQIKAELIKAIDLIIETNTQDDNGLGWIGMNLSNCMANAAMSVLEATVDLNEYLNKENLLS